MNLLKIESHANIWFSIILLISIILKNPFSTQPFIGHFGSYQSIVAMIARDYVRFNFSNVFLPNSFLLMEGKPALEMIYFPFASLISAVFWYLFGGALDFWGRFQAIFFSAIGTWLFYLWTKRERGVRFALAATFLFAFSPMGLIYGRTFMNESVALTLLVLSFFLFQMWKDEPRIWKLIIVSVTFSLVIILRLHFIVAFPAFIWVLLTPQAGYKLRNFFIFSIISITLCALWFYYTYIIQINYVNVHTSLFVQAEVRDFPDSLLWSYDFWIQVGVKAFLFRMIGPFTLVLAVASFFLVKKRLPFWTLIFFLATIGLALLIPSKFYRHPFYLLCLNVPGCYLGALSLVHIATNFSQKILISTIALIFITNVALILRPAYARVADEVQFIETARLVRESIAPEARVVTLHGTSLDLLYYLDRHGYSFVIGEDRSPTTLYYESIKFSNLTEVEFHARREAWKSSTTWLEYLIEKNGMNYFLAYPASQLNKEPSFKNYLFATHEEVKLETEDAILFKLMN